ncbi:MAG: hypothetical protein LCH53_04220 [Bacteroidetes bacterium]|nr:hypothetical protein [Bacteroidota bacterium]
MADPTPDVVIRAALELRAQADLGSLSAGLDGTLVKMQQLEKETAKLDKLIRSRLDKGGNTETKFFRGLVESAEAKAAELDALLKTFSAQQRTEQAAIKGALRTGSVNMEQAAAMLESRLAKLQSLTGRLSVSPRVLSASENVSRQLAPMQVTEAAPAQSTETAQTRIRRLVMETNQALAEGNMKRLDALRVLGQEVQQINESLRARIAAGDRAAKLSDDELAAKERLLQMIRRIRREEDTAAKKASPTPTNTATLSPNLAGTASSLTALQGQIRSLQEAARQQNLAPEQSAQLVRLQAAQRALASGGLQQAREELARYRSDLARALDEMEGKSKNVQNDIRIAAAANYESQVEGLRLIIRLLEESGAKAAGLHAEAARSGRSVVDAYQGDGRFSPRRGEGATSAKEPGRSFALNLGRGIQDAGMFGFGGEFTAQSMSMGFMSIMNNMDMVAMDWRATWKASEGSANRMATVLKGVFLGSGGLLIAINAISAAIMLWPAVSNAMKSASERAAEAAKKAADEAERELKARLAQQSVQVAMGGQDGGSRYLNELSRAYRQADSSAAGLVRRQEEIERQLKEMARVARQYNDGGRGNTHSMPLLFNQVNEQFGVGLKPQEVPTFDKLVGGAAPEFLQEQREAAIELVREYANVGAAQDEILGAMDEQKNRSGGTRDELLRNIREIEMGYRRFVRGYAMNARAADDEMRRSALETAVEVTRIRSEANKKDVGLYRQYLSAQRALRAQDRLEKLQAMKQEVEEARRIYRETLEKMRTASGAMMEQYLQDVQGLGIRARMLMQRLSLFQLTWEAEDETDPQAIADREEANRRREEAERRRQEAAERRRQREDERIQDVRDRTAQLDAQIEALTQRLQGFTDDATGTQQQIEAAISRFRELTGAQNVTFDTETGTMPSVFSGVLGGKLAVEYQNMVARFNDLPGAAAKLSEAQSAFQQIMERAYTKLRADILNLVRRQTEMRAQSAQAAAQAVFENEDIRLRGIESELAAELRLRNNHAAQISTLNAQIAAEERKVDGERSDDLIRTLRERGRLLRDAQDREITLLRRGFVQQREDFQKGIRAMLRESTRILEDAEAESENTDASSRGLTRRRGLRSFLGSFGADREELSRQIRAIRAERLRAAEDLNRDEREQQQQRARDAREGRLSEAQSMARELAIIQTFRERRLALVKRYDDKERAAQIAFERERQQIMRSFLPETAKVLSEAWESYDQMVTNSRVETLRRQGRSEQDATKIAEREGRKRFLTGKAIAIAETLVSTYYAAQEAFASRSKYGTLAATASAALAVASGLSRVAAIAATTIGGRGARYPGDSGSSGGGGMGIQTQGTSRSVYASAPPTPLAGAQASQQAAAKNMADAASQAVKDVLASHETALNRIADRPATAVVSLEQQGGLVASGVSYERGMTR